MSQFAVNGKVPVSVWCPSRDDASVGTSTLRDLVGSNDGTLTNMDPATDWVSDTDAGGVRALDFDGVNDRVQCFVRLLFNASFSISCWVKLASLSQSGAFFKTSPINNGNGIGIGVGFNTFDNDGNRLIGLRETLAWHGTLFDLGLNWFHCLYVYVPPLQHTVFINGVSRLSFSGIIQGTFTDQIQLGGYENAVGRYANLRADDFRLWIQALDVTDAATLWNSGNGRGRLVGGLINPIDFDGGYSRMLGGYRG